ncbi:MULTISPECIES: hypothetical protein [Sporosarcina]|uniref:hypothetical protein n=1 Tax=Sporosarcina TaxID=1569 RepID=UPI0005906A3B|nr:MULTISPECIES: hypothetical protein [Sporosarcina]WJY27235.1 hypothetical protein QWT68_14535 [Sporosarcina sp. 0.2-SM1T-5]
MIRKSLLFVAVFFLCKLLYQWLFSTHIRWKEDIGMAAIGFFVFLLFEWADHRHEVNQPE